MTKSSTLYKTSVYLVVHPSLFHFITLKYARTLHKRRPCDARTNAPHTTQPQASHLARSGVRTCTHKDASTCMLHPLNEKASQPPPSVGWHAGGGEGGGPDGGRRVQHRPPRACEEAKGRRPSVGIGDLKTRFSRVPVKKAHSHICCGG